MENTGDNTVEQLLDQLERIRFLENCGKPIDQDWAVFQRGDIIDALFDSSGGSQLVPLRLSHANMMVEWIKDNVTPNPYDYLTPFRDRVRLRIKEVYNRRIFPVLPHRLKRASPGERSQCENVFTWDLMELAIESSLISKGMPPGLYTKLLSVYLAGRFPCDWEGTFPEGRVVVL